MTKEPKTATKLINDLKKPTPTIETVGVPRPIEGQLSKTIRDKQFLRENKLTTTGTQGDKVNKVIKLLGDI